MRRDPFTFVVTASLSLALSLFAGCRREDAVGEAPGRAVRCAPAVTAAISDAIELRGTVSPLPDRDAQIAPQVAGRLLRVDVREGDAVTAGQTVAHVDGAPLVDEARAADAAVAKTRAEVQNATATFARVERVFQHGIAARQEVDDAKARAASAAAAQREAEATMRRARRQVDRSVVRSPLAGVVVRLFRRPGELVDGTPATPVVEVADPSQLELTADATASDLVRLRTGQAADVTIAALPGAAWTGTVRAVSPAVDRTTGLGVVRVLLDFSSAARPPIGVLGTAHIRVGSPRPAVVVPKEALRSGAGAEMQLVLCGADGLAHVRPIARGAAAGGNVEAPGLAAGQAVVVEPVIGIVDGERIQVSK